MAGDQKIYIHNSDKDALEECNFALFMYADENGYDLNRTNVTLHRIDEQGEYKPETVTFDMSPDDFSRMYVLEYKQALVLDEGEADFTINEEKSADLAHEMNTVVEFKPQPTDNNDPQI